MPLTARLPKPLIPIHQKPLITYAFDHLIHAGFTELIVNTHHLAAAYGAQFPASEYHGAPIIFRHEPELLETAGGIANIADLVQRRHFIVYNGDILTDLPLEPALEDHRDRGNLATLVLRSTGGARHIAWDPGSGKIVDIRNRLETGSPSEYQFTGIYLVSPEFVSLLTPGKKESVIPIFLDVIRRENAIGGILIDDGSWWDLGHRDAYLEASAALCENGFPLHGRDPLQRRVHPGALIHPGARLCPRSCIGEGATVEDGAEIAASVLWPGARATAGSRLRRCIVRHNAIASGECTDADI